MQDEGTKEKASFRASGQQLAATVYKPDKPNDRGVLFIHGWKSSQKTPSEYAKDLVAKGFWCLTFDLRGMGDSEGAIDSLTRKDFLEDCVCAYDYFKSKSGVDSIAVVGSSFGSYMACLLTSKRKVESLVLRVPADYSDRGFSDQPQAIISDQLDRLGSDGPKPDPEGSYALEALSRFPGKSLIVQSEADTIVDNKMVARFLNAAQPNLRKHVVMKQAPHSLSSSPRHKAEFGLILNEWFTGSET
jgi:esterase/lipase